MASGKYKIPKEYQDEDKYFRYFTKKQLLYIFVAGLISAGIIKVFSLIHLSIIGWVIGVILTVGAGIIPRFPMPQDKYLIGGGMPLEIIIKRLIVKQLPSSKKIYISNANNQEED